MHFVILAAVLEVVNVIEQAETKCAQPTEVTTKVLDELVTNPSTS